MSTLVRRGLPEPEAEEVESCCHLLGKITSLATEQAHGAVSLPPESLVNAFSLVHALITRVQQLLTQALTPEPPPAPPEPEPVEANVLELPEHEVRSR